MANETIYLMSSQRYKPNSYVKLDLTTEYYNRIILPSFFDVKKGIIANSGINQRLYEIFSHFGVDYFAYEDIMRCEKGDSNMLIQFIFKNYKSFKDEAILDLSAAKMTEFSDRVVSIGGEKILPVAAIYGANASGKSNVYSAFE